MTLRDLVGVLELGVIGTVGDLSPDVRGATHDSREVAPGDLFIAVPGMRLDGHAFLAEAASRGAAAALVQGREGLARVPPGMAAVAVADTRAAMPDVAAAVYRDPSAEIDLIGVTGTNGKSSTCYFLDSIARAMGQSSGLLTTLEIRMPNGESHSAARTTPEATTLQRWLRRMADAGSERVAMEVSSHALDLGRVAYCRFAGIVFTNLTQDHLDWHKTMERYFESKVRLFTREVYGRDDCVAAINIDDPYGARLRPLAECRTVTFGFGETADVSARNVRLSSDCTRFELVTGGRGHSVRLHLLGRFAAWNALAAAALSLGMGSPLDCVLAGMEGLQAVPGRLEPVGGPAGPRVLVDYAHSPASVASVLQSVREFCTGRLIYVFGCGGDRDTGKRPLMGRAAAEGSDVVFVTSDNPRSESPEAIIDMIVPGLGDAPYHRVTDRREAIHRAVAMARPDDAVVIAGKGHETYMEFADRTIHFDDREVAREALAARGCGS